MENSKIINVVIVILIICIVWWVIVWLLKKLLKPHVVIVQGKSNGKSTGLISTGKNSSGDTATIVDESISDNREVGEILRINKNLKVAIRNVLLIDNSGSITNILDQIKDSAKAFIDAKMPEEKIAIYSFSDDLIRLSDFDDSISNLKEAVEKMQPMGTTALNDSLIDISIMLDNLKDYYNESDATIVNIILFTDGQDNTSKKGFDELIDKLSSKSVFVVCTGDADIDLMVEIAKNPKNVYYLDGQNTGSIPSASTQNVQTNGGIVNTNSTAPNLLGINTGFKDIREAFTDIRSQIKGRGSLAYVMLNSPNNFDKKVIRGFVNSRGEIFHTGIHGEGSVFLGLCENPVAVSSKVFIGKYINRNSSIEDYTVTYNGKFGKEQFDVSPLASAAGAFVIYDKFKEFKKDVKKDNILESFAKTALISALIWLPVFLIYWELKAYAFKNKSLFSFLGREFDIAITLLILFFMIWFIINNLWVNYLRKNKRFSAIIEAINKFVGLKSYSSLIISISVIGIINSLVLFLPFAYIPLFCVVAIAFTANLTIGRGGGQKWIVDQKISNKPASFVGIGDEVTLDWSFQTTEEIQINEKLILKIDPLDVKENNLKTFSQLLNDEKSKKYIQYISDNLIYISIENNLTFLDEYLMIGAICQPRKNEDDEEAKSIDSKIENEKLLSPTQIIYNQRMVNPTNKLLLISAILQNRLTVFKIFIDTNDNSNNMLAIKATEEEKDSPWVQSISDEYHFIFRYNEESGIYFPMDKTIFNQKISSLKWINI
jgi:hypothetical protein